MVMFKMYHLERSDGLLATPMGGCTTFPPTKALMENAIFSAGSDPKPPFHGGGRSRKVSLRFEKSALCR